MAIEPLFQVRAPKRVHEAFEEAVKLAQARMALGTLKRADVLEMAVGSLSAVLTSEQVHGLQPPARPPDEG